MKRNIKFYSLDKHNIVFLENFELDWKRIGEIRNLDRINFPISLSKIFGTTNTDSIREASLNAIKSFTPYLLESDLYVFRNTETNKYPEEYENGTYNYYVFFFLSFSRGYFRRKKKEIAWIVYNWMSKRLSGSPISDERRHTLKQDDI